MSARDSGVLASNGNVEGMCEKVTKELHLLPSGSLPMLASRKNESLQGAPLDSRFVYQGYVFTDVSTRTDDGRYRARVAIISLDGTRTRSQRFIDLEVYPTQEAALNRVITLARSWIDTEINKDQLSLPTNFAGL